MFPGTLTQLPQVPLLAPDNLPWVREADAEEGGPQLSVAALGNQGTVYTAVLTPGIVTILRGAEAAGTVVVPADTWEFAFAFDQAMRPLVASSTRGKHLSMYWYDPTAAAFVTTALGSGRCPRLTLDDKRPLATGGNDVILGYIRQHRLHYRIQRERFLTEHMVAEGIPSHAKLRRLGMGTDLRLHFDVS